MEVAKAMIKATEIVISVAVGIIASALNQD
jgi:hypothetical protein